MNNLNSLNSIASFQKGGAPASFVPTDIAGLTLWLKADTGVFSDAGTTPATNGQTVQQWNDQSGNNNHVSQATGALRPTYQTGQVNSKPALSYDGTGDTMVSTNTFLQKHVFIVTKITPTNNYQGLFETLTGVEQGIRTDQVVSDTYRGGPGTTNEGDWTVGNESSFLVNGGTTFSPIPVAYHTVEGAITSSSPTAIINIGAINNSRFWAGWIAEFIVYNSQLSVANASRVRQYLGTKYGITVV